MENASKALLMAGAILISLIVISAFVFAYRDLTSVKRQEAENQKVEEIAEFNKSFESYEKDLNGTQIFSLANKIQDYNDKYVNGMNEGYQEISFQVRVGNDIKNKEDYIKLQNDVDNMMKTYKSSNYLEALYNAYEKLSGTDEEKTKAQITIEAVKEKIGNAANDKQKIDENYKTYNEYKVLKNKKFKSEGVEYYPNGRIKSMKYAQID